MPQEVAFDWTFALALPYSYGEERPGRQRGLGF